MVDYNDGTSYVVFQYVDQMGRRQVDAVTLSTYGRMSPYDRDAFEQVRCITAKSYQEAIQMYKEVR